MMVSNEEIRQNWKKIDGQLKEARRFLDEEKIDDALYFVWIAAENIVNSLKTAVNGFYLKDHRQKTYVLKDYFVLGMLKKDYSKTFKRLSKYRLVAEFHPYISIPKDYSENDVVNYLEEIENMRKETEKILSEKGVLK